MKQLLTRDVPPRAAITVVALALVAGAVAGREEPKPGTQNEPAAASPSVVVSRAGSQPDADLPDLDLGKLGRAPAQEKVENLFATSAVLQPPQPAIAAAAVKPVPPPPPPAPTAPAMPFRYLGKMVDGDKLVVFLGRDQDHYSVSAGGAVDSNYRVESITDSDVTLVYTPLGVRQTLRIEASPNAN